jgi:glycosyltransferase involved in cell wall biosynthesis
MLASSNVRPDISVIICTHNRASSLKVTLEHLVSADRDGIQAEVIIVDNAGHDNTKDVVDSFRHLIPTRYLYEPTVGACGKSHALNRALDAGSLGELIAVLDDDTSPRADWFRGVMSISERWPEMDIFTGDTYIIWPPCEVPGWANEPKIHSWMFSGSRLGNSDSLLQNGRWFLGGHFWFRSRVLEGGRRFKDIWVTEGDFQLDLVEQGFRGVAGRDAVAGHRIQTELLQRDVALNRARKTGSGYAWLRLQPYRKTVKQARLLQEHPWLGRLFCLLNHLRWRLLHLISFLRPSSDSRFAHRLIAVERMTTYLELLRAANRIEDYSVWKRTLLPMHFDQHGIEATQRQPAPVSKRRMNVARDHTREI